MEKRNKRKTTPFGVNLIGSQVLYQVLLVSLLCLHLSVNLLTRWLVSELALHCPMLLSCQCVCLAVHQATDMFACLPVCLFVYLSACLAARTSSP